MTQYAQTLSWNPEGVEKALRRKGIHGREGLANHPLLSKSSVYRQFRDDLSGTATTSMLAAISCITQTPIGQLVKDPWR